MEENNNNGNQENNSDSNNKIYQVIIVIISIIAVAFGIGLNSTLNNEDSQVSNITSESVTENETGEYANLNIDEDHIGGAYKVIEELKIGELYIPATSNDTKTFQNLLTTIENNDINVNKKMKASNETTYSLGEATWNILNVDNETDSNDASIVIELYYEDTNYLFMGDATTNVENNSEILWDEVDVLKVAHHGSDTSTSQEFLDTVNPKYAIISVGIDNIYNLPDEKVINILENKSSIKEIYRTDEDGTIWLTSDGVEIEFTKLDYNLDGSGRKQANIERRLLAFFFCVNNMV